MSAAAKTPQKFGVKVCRERKCPELQKDPQFPTSPERCVIINGMPGAMSMCVREMDDEQFIRRIHSQLNDSPYDAPSVGIRNCPEACPYKLVKEAMSDKGRKVKKMTCALTGFTPEESCVCPCNVLGNPRQEDQIRLLQGIVKTRQGCGNDLNRGLCAHGICPDGKDRGAPLRDDDLCPILRVPLNSLHGSAACPLWRIPFKLLPPEKVKEEYAQVCPPAEEPACPPSPAPAPACTEPCTELPPAMLTSDMVHRIIQGDVMDGLRSLPDGCVQCCVTSPPYWGLRDYGVDGQIGLEKTPEEYVQKMVEVFREVRRVLRDDGTLWLNLGDSYASNWPCGTNRDEGRNIMGNSKAAGDRSVRPPRIGEGLKEKDMVGIPWRVAFALQADGWYLRSDIIWAKRNCMPESVTDRPTKAHEYIFLLTKQPRYYYDGDAIREPAAEPCGWDRSREQGKDYHHNDGFFKEAQTGRGLSKWKPNKQDLTGNPTYTGFNERWKGKHSTTDPQAPGKRALLSVQKAREESGSHDQPYGITRNARTVWTIATQARPEAHFATFPDEIPRRCIAAGTSGHGCCPKCGAPYRRIIETSGGSIGKGSWTPHEQDDVIGAICGAPTKGYRREFKGWKPTCDCNAGDPVPCIVLDPFWGTGTVTRKARDMGRSSVGIEINPEYIKIGRALLQVDSQLDTGVVRFIFEAAGKEPRDHGTGGGPQPYVQHCCGTCGHHKGRKTFHETCPRLDELLFKGGTKSAKVLMEETARERCGHWVHAYPIDQPEKFLKSASKEQPEKKEIPVPSAETCPEKCPYKRKHPVEKHLICAYSGKVLIEMKECPTTVLESENQEFTLMRIREAIERQSEGRPSENKCQCFTCPDGVMRCGIGDTACPHSKSPFRGLKRCPQMMIPGGYLFPGERKRSASTKSKKKEAIKA